ncbi:hypothetical protein EDD37DRAFT_638873 [Exophiala viscosa]|uniref:Uncharacterized protein n=1 Tax=Exophiala viscosa TaxID=2486360 RepID=A0AAN6DLN0_9EURO|nr:hypothetical protein EDD36DRAFT_446645 [Exophiala viscosa]KAI1620749.1 hypothetical protein EDD37DRAFT_638873 [Exophiala viscosa]
MSTNTNPFRRNSSLKTGPPDNSSTTSIAEHRGTSPLSVNTKVTTTKHVNFASPPAALISPVSYPESPESARQEYPSFFRSPSAPLSLATTYSQALSSDPFAAETSDGDDDKAIEQALRNTNYNNAVVVGVPTSETTLKGSDVRDTLARFASGPRASAAYQQTTTGTNEQSGSAKLTMDVDAFKRMLLTGERQSARLGDGTSQNTHAVSVQPVSDNSSTADTASISQRSIFETAPPMLEESPRTSEELDSKEAEKERASLGSASAGRKPPAPPKSRRGKSVHETGDAASVTKFDSFINTLSVPVGQNASFDKDSLKPSSIDQSAISDRFTIPPSLESQKRTPPTLPLARRKSERQPGKPALARNSSSQISVLSDDPLPSPTAMSAVSRAPPPPPARRMTTASERRPSLDVIHDLEEDNNVETQAFPQLSSAESRPGTVQTPFYLKRTSQLPPPPPPPPRRGRAGSSRSSTETQRPSLGALGVADLGAGEPITRRDSSEARDILAEIAALQREVDAARASAG